MAIRLILRRAWHLVASLLIFAVVLFLAWHILPLALAATIIGGIFALFVSNRRTKHSNKEEDRPHVYRSSSDPYHSNPNRRILTDVKESRPN
ncbi:hypothetical protein [Levilactobacillus bambusae]|uniref:Uncharacterized protein n=1 Tax=Levilactobacillus bambusae TaxID=2024736 RepID=A0A2V1N2S5_9LACO|nr:hypothetical protein [Levilactobacillus bambusae]PWG00420.1 hypothetical protein DCM90_05705 [Levilactobacillus bambusae]